MNATHILRQLLVVILCVFIFSLFFIHADQQHHYDAQGKLCVFDSPAEATTRIRGVIDDDVIKALPTQYGQLADEDNSNSYWKLRQALKSNDRQQPAYHLLQGYALLIGADGHKADAQAAFQQFSNVAAAGNHAADKILAAMYLAGLGTPVDAKKAVAAYAKSDLPPGARKDWQDKIGRGHMQNAHYFYDCVTPTSVMKFNMSLNQPIVRDIVAIARLVLLVLLPAFALIMGVTNNWAFYDAWDGPFIPFLAVFGWLFLTAAIGGMVNTTGAAYLAVIAQLLILFGGIAYVVNKSYVLNNGNIIACVGVFICKLYITLVAPILFFLANTKSGKARQRGETRPSAIAWLCIAITGWLIYHLNNAERVQAKREGYLDEVLEDEAQYDD